MEAENSNLIIAQSITWANIVLKKWKVSLEELSMIMSGNLKLLTDQMFTQTCVLLAKNGLQEKVRKHYLMKDACPFSI